MQRPASECSSMDLTTLKPPKCPRNTLNGPHPYRHPYQEPAPTLGVQLDRAPPELGLDVGVSVQRPAAALGVRGDDGRVVHHLLSYEPAQYQGGGERGAHIRDVGNGRSGGGGVRVCTTLSLGYESAHATSRRGEERQMGCECRGAKYCTTSHEAARQAAGQWTGSTATPISSHPFPRLSSRAPTHNPHLTPFSTHTSSYVSPSSGLNGLAVRPTVPLYPATANAATRSRRAAERGGSAAASSRSSLYSRSSALFCGH
jgi:hypothetical protein